MKFPLSIALLLPSIVLSSLSANTTPAVPQEAIITTADQGYDEGFIDLVEMIYGEGFLSQGGSQSIEEMMDGINLEGKKALDLGSGLGMYDIHLAKHHDVEIVGIDPQAIMLRKAQQNLGKYQDTLKGKVYFQLMKDPLSLSQFPDASFDVIFSKESILHVPLSSKDAYFKEIYRVLKPGGTIVIMDWMRNGTDYSANTKKMMEMDEVAFELQTPKEYQSVLDKVGFKKVQLIDTTEKHAVISEQNIDSIHTLEKQLKARFGEQEYNYSLESWGYQRDAFVNRELLTGIFRATK